MQERELDYRMFLQREDFFLHQPLRHEKDFYSLVASGDVDSIIDNKKKYPHTSDVGKGGLSSDPLTNEKYHMIINTALTSRACIEAGMPQEVSYTLSDMYIQRADCCTDIDSVRRLNDDMVMDYAVRMNTLYRLSDISRPIRKAVDYIFNHLDDSLNSDDIARSLGMSRQYFSQRFHDEMGMSFRDFVTQTRTKAACAILTMSDYPIVRIAEALHYASQSIFSQSFKHATGYTPGEYRRLFGQK